MAPGEAREWLGVTEGVEPEALRRAYLRKVKEHKPERDPAGFQKTREAYELLAAARPVASEPSPSDPPAAAAGPPPELARLAELATPEERLALLEALIEEHPDQPHVVYELELELRVLGRGAEAAELLRGAIVRGVPRAREALFAFHAERLTAGEIEELRALDHPHRAILLATALAARDETDEALSLARDAIAAGALEPVAFLALVLRLFERRERAAARALLQAIRTRLEESGQGLRLPPASKVRLLWVRELGEVSDWASASLVEALAYDLRHGTLEDTRAALWSEVDESGTVARLVREAPALVARFAPVLVARSVPEPTLSRAQPAIPMQTRNGYVSAMMGVLLVLLFLGRLACSDRPSTSRSRVAAPSAVALDERVVFEVRTRSDDGPQLCFADRRGCEIAERVSLGLDRRLCTEADRELRRLEDRSASSFSAELAELTRALSVRYETDCGERPVSVRPLPAPEPAVIWTE